MSMKFNNDQNIMESNWGQVRKGWLEGVHRNISGGGCNIFFAIPLGAPGGPGGEGRAKFEL